MFRVRNSLRPLRTSLVRFSTALAVSAAISVATGSVPAAILHWDGGTTDIAGDGDSASAGGTGTWNSAILNWDAGASPHVNWVDGNDAVFAGAAGTVTLGAPISANSISLGTNNYTLATDSGALTLATGITTTSSFHQIAGVNGLALSAGAQAFNIVGGLRISTPVSGSGTITKTGNGMVSFTNTSNSFTGKYVINQGSFGFGADGTYGAVPGAFVPDAITINGGTLVNGLVSGAGGGFDNGGTQTIHANRGITLGASNGTIQVGYGAGTHLRIAGVISGAGSLTKTDSGSLSLYGANTYAGGTSVNGGVLSVGEIAGGSANEGSNTSLGSGAVSVAAGAQLMFAGNNLTIGNDVTLNGDATQDGNRGALVGGRQDGGSANKLTGTLTLNGTGDRSVSTWWEDKSLELAGKVTGAGNLAVVRIRSGNAGSVIILSNTANDYTGTTIIDAAGTGNAPILRLGADNVVPNGAGKGDVTSNGTFDVNGKTETINGLNGNGSVFLRTNGKLTVGDNNASSTFAGRFSGQGATSYVAKTGSGSFTLSGTVDNDDLRARVDAGTLILGKTSTGAVHAVGSGGNADYALVINGGTAQLGGTGDDQIYLNSAVQMTGGTFDFAGKNEGFDGLAGSAGTISNSVAATTSLLTLGQNNSAGSPVFGGSIQNGSGTMAVTKVGNGIQTLQGTNTYTGQTTVQAGTLLINGSISGIAQVNGGTLGGIGTTGAINLAGGTLAPGSNGIGTLASGGLTLSGTSALSLEINITAPNSVTTDLVNIGGDLVLDLGNTSVFALLNLGSDLALAPGTTITFLDYSGTWNGGTFAGYADDSVFNHGINAYRISYNGVDNATSAVVLNVVPEPASLAAMLAGAGVLLGRRRRNGSLRSHC